MSRETAKQDLQAIINAAAEKEGVDPELMQKIGGSESSLVATAKNPKSTAKGLFQFVDKTWAEMGGKPGEQYNPQKNAELGAKYIKKNFEALSSALGREPTYGEVYAAHFFGTTGAKTLLTKADPSAPIEQSLAMFESPKRVQKVLKQNPNLQGKTTGQVLEELNAKMGGSKQPTVMAQEPAAPSAKPSGFFRRPVPRFIRSEAPNLGTGYNAALALMGMSDDDALTTAQETVAQNEEDNAVADFGQAKQMLASLQAPNAFAGQQPRMMAKGGIVQLRRASPPVQREQDKFKVFQQNTIRPEDTRWMEDTNKQIEKYKSEAEAYNAAVEKYNNEVYNPYKKQVDDYNALSDPNPDSAPVAPPPFEMTRPVEPNVTQEIIDQRVAAARKAAIEDAEARSIAIAVANQPRNFNLAGFGMAGINAPSMFRKGGEAKSEQSDHDKQAARFFEELSTSGQDVTVRPSFTTSPAYTTELGVGYQRPPTSVQGKLEAMLPLFDGQAKVGVSGVAVKPENQRLMTMPGELSLGYKRTTGPHSVNVEARRSINAMPTPGGGRGHMYGANVNYAYKFAKGGDVAPVNPTNLPEGYTISPPSSPSDPFKYNYTTVQPRSGYYYAYGADGQRIEVPVPRQIPSVQVPTLSVQVPTPAYGLAGIVQPAYPRAYTPPAGAIGSRKPVVQKYNNTSMYSFLPSFAEGGDVAPEKGSAKAMLKEVGRSTQYLPADIAGSPVDLINLGLKGVDALTGSKLASELPVGGAEWLIDKANKYGLMDKPTGSMTETLTRFATGLASPVGVAKGVAMAGNKAATVSRKALDEISELSSASKAKKAADIAEAEPTVIPKAPLTPTLETAPKSQSRSMLDEIDPEVRKLIEEPKAQPRFQGPELPKRTLTTATRERPFVSPLDKFFAQGDKPVTVEQLTNQLAKSSRDYETNRVNQLLEGKSPKDKVRPSDLLKQLEETSPSRLRLKIKEPDPKKMDRFHSNMENPFPSKPMGTVNLLEDITPQEKLADIYTKNISDKSSTYGPAYVPENEANKAMQELELFFASPMAKNSVGQNLAQQFKADAPKIRDLTKKVDQIYQDMRPFDFPLASSSRFGFDFFKEQTKLINAAHEKYPELSKLGLMERLKQLDKIVDPAMSDKYADAALSGLDKMYGTNMLSHKQALGNDWSKLTTSEKNKIVEGMLGDVIGGDYTKTQVQLKELKRPYSDAEAKVRSEQRVYSGEHSSITADSENFGDIYNKPVSFSRFQDVTLPTKEKVMVIPELQSDRFQAILEKGTKGGNQYKDADELAKLDQELNSVTTKLYKTTDAPVRDQLKLDRKKIEQRMANLRERIQQGTYNTPEFTPGIERMPQVMQQIMVKNAVIAGIQRGKNGIILPGSDSKQAQLYEKLPNNIRSVVKDLGPGFEMRKVPLKYEDGSTIERYGIFWKDDAAKRIDKEGVRFKNGGMVDKNDDENQKYI